METRANHVLIGAFTLAVIAAAFGFILWLAKAEIDQQFAYYDILFEGSVTGLNVAGDVRYQGVRVGQVKEIRIYEKDPKLVRVRIEIDSNTPVNSASQASLEFFGITGVLFVQISSGEVDAPPLKALAANELPIIPSNKSGLEALFTSAPKLMENAITLVERLSELVNTDNRQTINDILNNARAVSGSFAGRSKEIDEMIVNATQMTHNLSELTARLDRLSVQAEEILDEDVRKLLHETTGFAAGLNMAVSNNQDALNTFGERGLREFTFFIIEARQLVTTLDRVAQRLESDPARFFLGNSASEFEAK